MKYPPVIYISPTNSPLKDTNCLFLWMTAGGIRRVNTMERYDKHMGNSDSAAIKSMAESWRTSSQIMHYAHSKRTKAASDLCRNNGSSWYCIMLHHPGKLELKWGDLTGIWYIMMKSEIPQHALNNHFGHRKLPSICWSPVNTAPCTRYQRVQSQGCRWHIGCPPVVKCLLDLTPRKVSVTKGPMGQGLGIVFPYSHWHLVDTCPTSKSLRLQRQGCEAPNWPLKKWDTVIWSLWGRVMFQWHVNGLYVYTDYVYKYVCSQYVYRKSCPYMYRLYRWIFIQ